ncbi:MAG: hypothetical protein AVDCRST_MAG72-2641 [uncultured Nocardioidaceae bacterium]|uniref:DUF1761 domain-containing protein n=1 Tax=uncultured Nocardioidaceae bacterium TaxID=253824 RepID=A0A6J4MPH6_9ACTN|nr:MAG: hypothetical protein AVDCRST_MAG72-2641 [uncultured Nocardioidaceae bacterium]
MPDINLAAVLVGTFVCLALGAGYYAVLGGQLAKVSEAAAQGGQPQAWQVAGELLRCLVLTSVLAGVASAVGADGVGDGVLLAVALWVGFPLVLWTGAMLHERTPWKLAAIHAGDWLVKLIVVTAIVSVWR